MEIPPDSPRPRDFEPTVHSDKPEQSFKIADDLYNDLSQEKSAASVNIFDLAETTNDVSQPPKNALKAFCDELLPNMALKRSFLKGYEHLSDDSQRLSVFKLVNNVSLDHAEDLAQIGIDPAMYILVHNQAEDSLVIVSFYSGRSSTSGNEFQSYSYHVLPNGTTTRIE